MNEKLKFTVLDGGLHRRALVFDYLLKFVSRPTKAFERKAMSEEMTKNPKWIEAQLAGFIVLLNACHKAFFVDDKGTGLGHIPQRVIDATEELMHDEAKTQMQALIEQNYSRTGSPQGAEPRATFVTFIKMGMGEVVKEMKSDMFMKIVHALVEFKNSKAGRDKTQERESGMWLKRKSAGEHVDVV